MFAALREKYEEMRELRRTDDGSYDPRERMAALAARFPGALREIDTLPLEEIERRISALANAERDPSHAMPWMRAQSRFHELVRAALATTRERNWLDAVYVRLAGELATTPDEVKALVFSPSSRERA
jgi:hypothetical protein